MEIPIADPKALIDDNQLAWDELAGELNPKLMRYAARLLKGRHDVEAGDVVNDAWISCKKAIVGSDRKELNHGYFRTAVQKCAIPKEWKVKRRNEDARKEKEEGKEESRKEQKSNVSLDQSSGGVSDGSPLKDVLAVPDPLLRQLDIRDLLKRTMPLMTDRQAGVIRCRIIKELTLEETAAELGLTFEEVRQAQKTGLASGDVRSLASFPTTNARRQWHQQTDSHHEPDVPEATSGFFMRPHFIAGFLTFPTSNDLSNSRVSDSFGNPGDWISIPSLQGRTR